MDIAYEIFGLSRISHESDSFVGKALRDEAAVSYRNSLITQQMGESGSPEG